jgi:hypothetical protein
LFQKKNEDLMVEKIDGLKNEKQNIFWNDSSLLSDILKDNYKKENLEFFEKGLKFLQNQRLINLRDWKKVTKEEKKNYPVGLKNLLDEVCGIKYLPEWDEMSEEEKMLKVDDFISFCTENKSKVSTLKFESEGFVFHYQKRKIPEKVMMKHICSNFLNFSRGVCLQQNWSLLTIIGGSGVGKSRLSYEVWNILKDYVQNHEILCIKWLDGDKEIFFKFKERILGCNLIEVFAKEANGDNLKINDTIEFHLGCSLATCLFKNNQNERGFVSISEMKRFASDKGKWKEFSNIDLILKCLNKLHGGSPLTIIWRLDEIQNVDREYSYCGSKVYQYISKLMGITLDFTSGNFIIPIISGTTNAIIKRDFTGLTFKIVSVPVFISDFSVDDALQMINEKILMKETNELRRVVEALGPIPRLVQFMVEYLIKEKGKYTIQEVYDFMLTEVVQLYRIGSWTDQKFNATVMLSILEKWKPQEYLAISPRIEEFIQDGVLFTTRSDHLFLPIVFVKILLKSIYGFDRKHLFQYLDRGILKEFEHVDLETFPVWFYAFKVFLYFRLGINSVNIEKFFHGAFMNEVNERRIINSLGNKKERDFVQFPNECLLF